MNIIQVVFWIILKQGTMADYVDWESLELMFNLEREQKLLEQKHQEYIHVEMEQMLNMFGEDDMDIF